jgi:hypothetical protein
MRHVLLIVAVLSIAGAVEVTDGSVTTLTLPADAQAEINAAQREVEAARAAYIAAAQKISNALAEKLLAQAGRTTDADQATALRAKAHALKAGALIKLADRTPRLRGYTAPEVSPRSDGEHR